MADDPKTKTLKAGAPLGVRLRGADMRAGNGRPLVTSLSELAPEDEAALRRKLESLRAATAEAKAKAAELRDEVARLTAQPRPPLTRGAALKALATEMETALARGEKAHDVLAKLRADRPELEEAFKN